MVVEVKGVYKAYGKNNVIKDINFSIDKNEIVALVGPNGAGKTTLFNIMATLHKADNGDIYIAGYHSQKQRNDVLRNMAFMQDASTLYPDLTGRDHLIFLANVRKHTRIEVKNVIQELGINGYIDKKVKIYSTGMKQHLLLAMAILCRPVYLIMDEPMNGLDPTGAALLREKMLKMRNNGTTILFSSHILSDVDKVADRILFIRQGEIINEQRLIQNNSSEVKYILTVDKTDKALDVLHNYGNGIEIKKVEGNKVQVTLHNHIFGKLLGKLHDHDIEVTDVEKSIPGAETMYREIYGETT